MNKSILLIVLYITIAYVLLMLVAWIYNFIIYVFANKEKVFTPKFYLKEIPFYLNKNAIYRIHTAGQFLGILVLTAIITFTILSNMTPFGVNIHYNLNDINSNISQIGPGDRVTIQKINGEKITKIQGDYVYFTTKIPFNFENATVKVLFKNSDPDQTFSLGFKDQEEYHYITKPFDVPFLNNINWVKNGYEPVLYQREQRYTSVDDFNSNPPIDGIIGTFEYQSNLQSIDNLLLPKYTPKKSETKINVPLRGKQVIYAYLNKEPFNLNILKQDLNWYDGPDDVSVKIYKGDDLVYDAAIKDDGITDNSKRIQPPQEIKIQNPGKELPEAGVYKIVINANDDTIIKQLRTNLHKIVFANSIFLADNKSVYQGIVASTSATVVYTNALTLSAQTYHQQGKQNIMVGDQILGVQTLKSNTYLPPKEDIARVVVPQNDVILNGFMGYFVFDKDQFFLPTQYHVLTITRPEDVGLVDYILTDYMPSHKEDTWQTNEQTFDINTAYIKDNKLNWVIKSPDLEKRNGSILIKDIEITFSKKGWM
jgi:hypothetical protein